ncbi:Ankyrin-3 [Tetrabaena socialis]|uniref:Ankyrin-3 n=1 Tax=Tetrabaena socialis TaxID=47790 RepID=A0A2J8A516_9CHLO|nr:Ankyrin-3 [Tetrabaena socialis]|eukprot:PNH07611.1 Ankyrin-3 [Tetrabaena socialis]
MEVRRCSRASARGPQQPGQRAATLQDVSAAPATLDAAGRRDVKPRPVQTAAENSLLVASDKGDKEEVERLLAKPAVNPNAHVWLGATPLHTASRLGQVLEVKRLLREAPDAAVRAKGAEEVEQELLLLAGSNVSARNHLGSTPLHKASQKGHNRVVEVLLRAGADVDGRNHDGCTALQLASQNGHQAVVDLLLRAGARSKLGPTPTSTARHSGHKEMAKVLRGLQLRSTSLHLAIQKGHTELVELLLAAGANVGAKDIKGKTPLHVACENGLKEAVEVLLAAEAEVAARDKDGSTTLHVACVNGHTAVVEVLLAAGANVGAKDVDGKTPLHRACENGHAEVAQVLLREGAEVAAKDKVGWGRCIDIAAYEQKSVWNKAANGARGKRGPYHCHREPPRDGGRSVQPQPRPQDKEGSSPLHDACRRGHAEVAEVLLVAGASVAAKTNNGTTPLHAAGDKRVVEVLLGAGASVAAKDFDGKHPLHVASEKGLKPVVELLLQSEAGAAARDKWGSTPLHFACQGGHTEVVEVLLAAGAQVAARSYNGFTPLHSAAAEGAQEVVELLLGAGADVTSTVNWGATPLLIASANGRAEVVEMLLRAGADAATNGYLLKSPLEYARDEGKEDIVALLESRGGIKCCFGWANGPARKAAGGSGAEHEQRHPVHGPALLLGSVVAAGGRRKPVGHCVAALAAASFQGVVGRRRAHPAIVFFRLEALEARDYVFASTS